MFFLLLYFRARFHCKPNTHGIVLCTEVFVQKTYWNMVIFRFIIFWKQFIMSFICFLFSLTGHRVTDLQPTPTHRNLPRSLEVQRNAPAVETLSMQLRRSWGQARCGFKICVFITLWSKASKCYIQPSLKSRTPESTECMATKRNFNSRVK